MSIWEKYTKESRDQYIQYLKVYGALSNLFRQKKGDMIPYLDSKFQETVYAKSFNSKNVDIGNTPHDILSEFGDERIGIGLKTWMNSSPSYQKVMQLKRYQKEIEPYILKGNLEDLAYKISTLKNQRMRSDYERLGLSEDKNIYHYVTRDKGKFVLQESTYPLIDINNIQNPYMTDKSFTWNDGSKFYKYTFGDSQIWQRFSNDYSDTHIIGQCEIDIIDDPFEFLIKAYVELINEFEKEQEEIYEVYLPLYSYKTGEVENKSGLNAWNAASKNKGSGQQRPLNEVYIPIPRIFHKKYPDFFTQNIFEAESKLKVVPKNEKSNYQVRFHLHLPNGNTIPALIGQQNMKSLQSGSLTERRPDGQLYGQSDLGQWLLVDVLGLSEREEVTREWLKEKGTDSVRLWRNKNDYKNINIDFAPIGAFDEFIRGEGVTEQE
ncbi:restriction endonuclease PLD domain-containing protein [Staphylococcus pseudintermedius]|uniref:restriction endonuclease PLD domain-containing protein n=1 Tax=Staphylococcus pseudintermedius TaxID=283734 RepID=UPI000CE4D9AA|nr:restriction endonuclease PLD domain-containing protein [Staphylococcus pseudintermedius]EGQ1775333.1 NgoFVII family restriction endonuclease [Staphylococcus pseudintermedius]EGQ2810611.1 NgoFVII family restriction endonuclease [Staphylococcus pseudintermedius]EGQ2831542.1 NgoFVII family restriction endonuclease [Staphylococcus pseudintermedius]EGQ3039936.1 NgoFVII family restriction endonuclease [Staphylococcus pseudintermedius]EGQ3547330.1 NgoFVII family restriction endonuclease [Staphyloc